MAVPLYPVTVSISKYLSVSVNMLSAAIVPLLYPININALIIALSMCSISLLKYKGVSSKAYTLYLLPL